MPIIARVFGIPIEGWPLEIALASALHHTPACWIVTANPEILLHAHRDAGYAQVLKQADVRLVDGFGLWLLLSLAGHKTTRVTGVDLAEALAQLAVQKSLKVALVGGDPGIAKQAATHLTTRFPGLMVETEEGGRINADGTDDVAGEEARNRLTFFAPDILLVAFGHPKQERWIARYLADFPSVKIAVGVGGTFDVWAGKMKRAPHVLRTIGLEWMWRLVHEPKRIIRILNAVIVFPFFFLKERLFAKP
jgi:N-acetylglucosaminyldiphosphoundecaprenol N-acetyl-beta-D-mannosaminyltransferase